MGCTRSKRPSLDREGESVPKMNELHSVIDRHWIGKMSVPRAEWTAERVIHLHWMGKMSVSRTEWTAQGVEDHNWIGKVSLFLVLNGLCKKS